VTQERFFQIVEDPDIIRRISYEELKTLALAYPYAHNLRSLLALKARQIEHPDAARNLATAAAYSLDRTRLFLLVAPQAIVPQQVLNPEEVLELKPIQAIKRELEALSPVEKTAEAPSVPVAAERAIPVPSGAITTDPGMEEAGLTVQETPAFVQPLTFNDWIGAFHPPVLEAAPPRTAPHKTSEPPPETPKTSGIAQQLAERSVAENQDVISETLAKLYAKQGYRDKAAQMYARLALLFPEKSAYFAAEIDKLKK
jgi:hypothetical protein